MDPIKEAFARAKQDIDNLQRQIDSLLSEIDKIKRTLDHSNSQTSTQTHSSQFQESKTITSTDNPTHMLTFPQDWPLEAFKRPISNTSIGNEGVPTDRQTDQQTDRQPISTLSNISQVSQVLDSLDSIKQSLRMQFKRLTSQEMLVFSTIYQLEEEGFSVDYSLISKKLSLSESSIRDYALKITKKGIPLTKLKQGNKKVLLSVPPELKRIASLPAILALREV